MFCTSMAPTQCSHTKMTVSWTCAHAAGHLTQCIDKGCMTMFEESMRMVVEWLKNTGMDKELAQYEYRTTY